MLFTESICELASYEKERQLLGNGSVVSSVTFLYLKPSPSNDLMLPSKSLEKMIFASSPGDPYLEVWSVIPLKGRHNLRFPRVLPCVWYSLGHCDE